MRCQQHDFITINLGKFKIRVQKGQKLVLGETLKRRRGKDEMVIRKHEGELLVRYFMDEEIRRCGLVWASQRRRKKQD